MSDDRLDDKTMGVKKSMNDGLGAPYSIMCDALSRKLAEEVKDNEHTDLQVTVGFKPEYTPIRVTMTLTSKIEYWTIQSDATPPTCQRHTYGPEVTVTGFWSEQEAEEGANDTEKSGRWNWCLETQPKLDERVLGSRVRPDVRTEAMSKATLGEDEMLGNEGSTVVKPTRTAKSKGMSSWFKRGMKSLQGRTK